MVNYNKKFKQADEQSTESAVSAAPQIQIKNCELVNVRSSAKIDDNIIGTLPEFSICYVVDTNGEWTRITNQWISGWVMTEYTEVM